MALINIRDVIFYLVHSAVNCSSSKLILKFTSRKLECLDGVKVSIILICLIHSFYQSFLAPATYWHDVNNEQIYRKYSSFLSIINNEVRRNEDYVQNLQRLRRLVLVKFVNDISVVPNESTWFGFYFPNGTSYPLELTDVYREDKLGLRRMINEGKLIRLLSPLAHLELDKDWFRQNLIPILMEK